MSLSPVLAHNGIVEEAVGKLGKVFVVQGICGARYLRCKVFAVLLM